MYSAHILLRPVSSRFRSVRTVLTIFEVSGLLDCAIFSSLLSHTFLCVYVSVSFILAFENDSTWRIGIMVASDLKTPVYIMPSNRSYVERLG